MPCPCPAPFLEAWPILTIDAVMAGLKVFFDSFSQPSRAVLILLQANKIPYQPCMIKIAQGETKTREDFMKVSPTKRVPAIDDNGFCLFESAAILGYLATKHKLPNHWYPSDPQQRAKVDEYLSWHSSNLRMGAAGTLFQKLFLPRMMGKEPDEKKVEETEKILKGSVKLLENYFLKDHKFISSDEISIADVQAICEFTQFWMAGVDPVHDKPRLARWMADCQQALEPHFDDVHKMVYKARDMGVFKGKL